MRLLDGKNIIVTGANRGIGRAIVEVIATNGANIFACARKKNSDFEHEMQILEEENRVTIIPVYFDLTNSEGMFDAIKFIRKCTDMPVNGLVNCAGILSSYRRFDMIPTEEAKKVFDVDFFSQIELTQLITRLMQRNKRGGSVVYISSIAALDGFFSSYDYVSCKAAINAAALQQARELGKSGIRVNAIAPGIVQTDMIANNNQDNLELIKPSIMLRRFGLPKEIANAVMFLLSDLSSYITGQVIRVDGGTNPPKSDWQ